MIVRTVLSVLLAVALLAAATPAIEDARREHTDAAVDSAVTELQRGADRLATADEAVRGPGATRLVAIRLPHRTWTDAGVDRLTLASGGPDTPPSVRWRVTGGTVRERRLSGLRIQTAADGPLTLSAPGRHRLVLELDGTPVDPVVTVRRFKPDEAATGRHARTATGGS